MAEPFLYNLVDKLYHGVMDNMPQAIQDRDVGSAFILASVGAYGVAKGLEWTSKNVMNKIIPNFDEKWMPKLEKAFAFGITAAPIIYALVDPEGAKAIISQHPTYTSGMAGVYAGSVAAVTQNSHHKSKKRLEKILLL